MARVFIASDSLPLARSAARAAWSAGHLIVSTWHSDGAPHTEDAQTWGFGAIRATQEIEGANVLLLVEAGTNADGGARYWLTGYAVRAMCRVVVFGHHSDENAMLRHEHHERVADLPALLALLATVEDRNASKH